MRNTLSEGGSGSPVKSHLGKKTDYALDYSPEHLYAIPRLEKRNEIGIEPGTVPFFGFDCWNHYEVSWLNPKGKPVVAIATLSYPCDSPYIVESKSLKLYFNGLNNTAFASVTELTALIQADLKKAVGAEVKLMLSPLSTLQQPEMQAHFDGTCLDALDITCDTYMVEPNYLSTEPALVEETVYSDLLKSNCLVTNQPDWGSVQIHYIGNQISHEGLLRYLVSFRNHNEFHEQCIERIFMDIIRRCKPQQLTVYGRYTRRGGLDINPYRSTKPSADFQALNMRLMRQ